MQTCKPDEAIKRTSLAVGSKLEETLRPLLDHVVTLDFTGKVKIRVAVDVEGSEVIGRPRAYTETKEGKW